MLVPANLAVALAKTSYLKIGPFARCFLYPDVQSSADTVADLFLDYVCEYGPSHRFFYADAFLTRQLSRSVSVHRLRMAFYQSGGATLKNLDPGAEFGNLEFVLATVNSLPLWPIVGQPVWDFARSPFDITHFMGTYGYHINKVPGVDRARFEITNQTDLASGSRIPPLMGGVEVHDIDKLNAVYVEDLITDNPSLGSKHLAWIVQHYDVISILHPRTRDETEGLQGGGTMRQTFIWYEAYPLLGCIRWLPPWPPAWINIEDYQGGDGGGGGASGFN